MSWILFFGVFLFWGGGGVTEVDLSTPGLDRPAVVATYGVTGGTVLLGDTLFVGWGRNEQT